MMHSESSTLSASDGASIGSRSNRSSSDASNKTAGSGSSTKQNDDLLRSKTIDSAIIDEEIQQRFDQWTRGSNIFNFLSSLDVDDVQFDGDDTTGDNTRQHTSDDELQLAAMAGGDVERDKFATTNNKSKRGSLSSIKDFFSRSFYSRKDDDDGGNTSYRWGGLEMEKSGEGRKNTRSSMVSVGLESQIKPTIITMSPIWEDYNENTKVEKRTRSYVETCVWSVMWSVLLIVTIIASHRTYLSNNNSLQADNNQVTINADHQNNNINNDISSNNSFNNNNDDLKDLLMTISPSLKRHNNLDSSPQHLAYDWIVAQNLPLSNYRIIQRYVLAVLYYSTGGNDWTLKTTKHGNNWLSEKNECSWKGLRCLEFKTHQTGESVTILNMEDNNMKGSIPMEIGELPFLEIIHFQNNQLTGLIPETIVTLDHLRELRLEKNALTGRLPNYIGNLKRLEYLSLSNNNLIGSIPPGLFDGLISIRSIDLRNNALRGSIPRMLFQSLKLIKSLNLSANRLAGTIPVGIVNLTALEEIDLANNELTGTIPKSIGYNIPNLYHINLGRNHLKGEIPYSMANLEQLRSLFLHDNELEGLVPDWFSTTSGLDRLTMHKNNLRGEVPRWLCDAEMEILTADCSAESDDDELKKVTCDCCTECFG